eukprot:gb/GFBE01062998.1/.p1 GENE.gb/GFBE01062998.1/~~gb/GFBE01062998.1/.p1  ORF type:complete len:442 (+),score=63.46 gb/GFBE01062998.1/:1-1326(+)
MESQDKSTLVSSIFKKFDLSGNGKIDSNELRQALKHILLTDEEVEGILQVVTKDEDSTIDYADFIKWALAEDGGRTFMAQHPGLTDRIELFLRRLSGEMLLRVADAEATWTCREIAQKLHEKAPLPPGHNYLLLAAEAIMSDAMQLADVFPRLRDRPEKVELPVVVENTVDRLWKEAADKLEALEAADLEEFANIKSPTIREMIIVMCVVILDPTGEADLDQGWSGAKELLAEQDLIEKMLFYLVGNISPRQIKKIRDLLDHSNLKDAKATEGMKHRFKACDAFLRWLHAICTRQEAYEQVYKLWTEADEQLGALGREDLEAVAKLHPPPPRIWTLLACVFILDPDWGNDANVSWPEARDMLLSGQLECTMREYWDVHFRHISPQDVNKVRSLLKQTEISDVPAEEDIGQVSSVYDAFRLWLKALLTRYDTFGSAPLSLVE